MHVESVSDERPRVLLLPLEHAPIVGHGIAQFAPEQGIAPFEISVELEVGAQLAVDAFEVLQLLVQDDYDALTLILQRRLVGDAKLHARPHRVDEVLREHDNHALRVVDGAHDLLGNAVADQPIPAMEADAIGVQAGLQLGQQLANQLLVLVGIGDEGIVGLVLVQLLLGHEQEAEVVIVEPYLELLLVDEIHHAEQADDDDQATQDAADQQHIRGTQLADFQLLERPIRPLAAVDVPHVVDALGLRANKPEQRQGRAVTAQRIASQGQVHGAVGHIVDEVLIEDSDLVESDIQQTQVTRQLLDCIQAAQLVVGQAQFCDVRIAHSGVGIRQLADAVVPQLECCLYQRCLRQHWQLRQLRSTTVHVELARVPLHPANAPPIALPVRRLVLADVVIGAHQRLEGHPQLDSVELSAAHVHKIETAHIPEGSRIQRGQWVLIEHKRGERCQRREQLTVEQLELIRLENHTIIYTYIYTP